MDARRLFQDVYRLSPIFRGKHRITQQVKAFDGNFTNIRIILDDKNTLACSREFFQMSADRRLDQGSRAGQEQADPRSLANFAEDCNVPTRLLGKSINRAEPEPGALFITITLAEGIELAEYPFPFLVGQSRPLVQLPTTATGRT